jgi:hypothetical protein
VPGLSITRRSPEGREGPDPLDAPDIIPRHNSGKARIAAPMREARSSAPAHRGARVIRTDALHFVLILREPRDGQEREQDSEDDPDINAHQSSGSYPPIHRSKRKPRHARGFQGVETMKRIQGSRCPRRPDTIPKRKSGKAQIGPGPPSARCDGPGLVTTRSCWSRRDQLTNAALAAWFGESEEPRRLSSVRLACRHGRMSTDRERPRPKIVPRG